jgi:transcription initiation factor TFIIB
MTYVQHLNSWNTQEHEFDEKCCKNPNYVEKDGFKVCSNCGISISRTIHSKPSGNYSQYEKNKKRQNERILTPIGPRTIFKTNRDGKGNDLSPNSLNRFQRLAKINRGLRTSIERNLWMALPKFKMISTKLHLPKYVSEEAYRIYILSAKKKLTLGRGINNILAAAFYTAIKIHEIPKTVEEISIAAQISKKDLIQNFKALYEEIIPLLNLELNVIKSNVYLIRFRKDLKLPMICQKKALKLINQCKKKGMRTSGKDPKGFAAAALYLTAKQIEKPRTQKEICKFTMISEVTLRARIKEFQSFQKL